jgi:hypothetical protein
LVAHKSTLCRCRCRTTAPHKTDTYTEALIAAEADGDVMRVMEVVTEARVLKHVLPPHALEAGIRTFAAGGQWQRAVDMLQALMAAADGSNGGSGVSPATARAVFQALADGGQAAAALSLLNAIEASGAAPPAAVRNLVVRTCAMGGELDTALELLEAMVDEAMSGDDGSDGSGSGSGSGDAVVTNEAQTFATVATECIRAGKQTMAEAVLDWRDYL